MTSLLIAIMVWPICATANGLTPISSAAEPLPVANLRIHRFDVYDPQDLGALGPLARIANAVHVTTRESVVRDLLLFEVGDPVDERRLLESERVLRRSGLFRTASVRGSIRGDSVDVDVVTRESWSTQAVTRFSATGGNPELTLGLAETNVLGTGNLVSAIYTWSERDNRIALGAVVRRFLGRYSTGAFSYNDGDLGIFRSLAIQQPWHSVYAPWSGAVSGLTYSGDVWLYRDGELSGRFTLDQDRADAYASLYTGRGTRFRVGLGLYLEDRVTRPHTGETLLLDEPMRNDRRRQPSVTVGFTSRRLLRLRYVDRSGIVEDHAVGHRVSVIAGAELEAWGSTNDRPYLGIDTEHSFQLGKYDFLSLRFRGNWHWQDEAIDDRELVGTLKAFTQRLPGHTLALRALAHTGEGFFPEELIYLGAENGLRGYSFRQFRGKQAVVANLEDRFYPGLGALTFELGFALFADAGYVWDEDESIRMEDIRSNVGAGLRVAGVNLSLPFRVDLARSLGPAGEWRVTFTAGELFFLTRSLAFPRPTPRDFGNSLE